MSKLSADLRVLIDRTSPKPPTRPLKEFGALIAKMEEEATEKGLGQKTWIAMAMAVVMTASSSAPIAAVAHHVVKRLPSDEVLAAVEFMREVGIICMAMNGVRIDAQRESH